VLILLHQPLRVQYVCIPCTLHRVESSKCFMCFSPLGERLPLIFCSFCGWKGVLPLGDGQRGLVFSWFFHSIVNHLPPSPPPTTNTHTHTHPDEPGLGTFFWFFHSIVNHLPPLPSSHYKYTHTHTGTNLDYGTLFGFFPSTTNTHTHRDEPGLR
jgi:hypothetical protein